MEFKDRLKQAREFKGLSQKAMAELVNCAPNALQKYEYGEQKPGFNILKGYRDLGFNVNWLLTGEGDMLLINEKFAQDNDLANKVANLMALIYETVDTWLEEQEKSMSPERKSMLIKLIYQQLQKDGLIDFERAGEDIKSIIEILNAA
ncbi:MAG: helix-turn-helix transcriptional regulator [Proteobacteria bacterium]|nr:helix-turn-helix transcriptional regulator [Pseudomonadota bacterium]